MCQFMQPSGNKASFAQVAANVTSKRKTSGMATVNTPWSYASKRAKERAGLGNL